MSSSRNSRRKYRNYVSRTDSNIDKTEPTRSTRKREPLHNNYIKNDKSASPIEMKTFKTNFVEPNVSFQDFILKEWDEFYKIVKYEIDLSIFNQNKVITQMENKPNTNTERMKIMNNNKNDLLVDFNIINTKVQESKKDMNTEKLKSIHDDLCNWIGGVRGKLLETVINKSQNIKLKRYIQHRGAYFCYEPTKKAFEYGGKSRKRNKKRNMRKKRKTIKTRK